MDVRPLSWGLLGALATALFALWFLFAGQWSWPVAAWGGGACLLATVAGAAAFARAAPGVRLRAAWARELLGLPWHVVAEFALLAVALARAVARGKRELGEFSRDTGVAGRDPGAVTRRAWTTLLASLPPNSYVFDVDPDTGSRHSHVLVPGGFGRRG